MSKKICSKKRLGGKNNVCAGFLPKSQFLRMPEVIVNVSNMSVRALMDSGCSRSIISLKLARSLNCKLLSCNEPVTLMNGSVSVSSFKCRIDINVSGRCITLCCLVSDLVFDYKFLLGMDAIFELGGVFIDKSGNVIFEQCCTALSSLSIDDVDFTAEFKNNAWTAKWKWSESDEPSLKNTVPQYRVSDECVEKYEKEIDEWIQNGWLEEFNGSHKGIIPLMAVLQVNKDKVRPVMDFRELNSYVSSHTAESQVCHKKLRKWRQFGKNLSIIDLKKAYLQVRIDPQLHKYQVVKYKGRKYCLTRLGFGLNSAPKIMVSILKKVFSLDARIESGVDSYIDDIIVNTDIVSSQDVLDHLKKYGLEGKEPVSLCDARVLGLQVESRNGHLQWRRDNLLDSIKEPCTRRDIFSWCGKLIGHYPVAGWLRPACSLLKRFSSDVKWDEKVSQQCQEMLNEIMTKVRTSDPVKGVWTVDGKDSVNVWCDASNIALGVVITVDGMVIEDASWIRKKEDPLHINAAELESTIKGVGLAIEWGFKRFTVSTDSSSVVGWLKSVVDKDKPVRTTGLSSMLIRRRVQILQSLINEYSIDVKVVYVKSSQNKADELTRVPDRWLRRNVSLAGLADSTRDIITNEHAIHHFGKDKTLFFCRKKFPGLEFSRSAVSRVINDCNRCRSIDPQPVITEKGELGVGENWLRLACDVTHCGAEKYLTIVDCGPSRYSIWKPIKSESVVNLAKTMEQVFRDFGPPAELVLDNFTSFKAPDFISTLKRWGVKPWYRCAYRPSGNSIVERNHRTIKRMAARSKGNILDMVYYYNIAPKYSRREASSPYNRLFNHTWRGHSDLKETQDASKLRTFSEGQQVFVKPPGARCTDRWKQGVVTKVNSSWNVEVNGIPRHSRDIRRVAFTASDEQSEDLSQAEEIDDEARRRPVRERKMPNRYRDFVLY